jgi:hypothetical protein
MQNCFQMTPPQMLNIYMAFHTTCVSTYTVNCIKMAIPKVATCYSWLQCYRTSRTVFILLGQVSVLHTLCFKPWFWTYFTLPFLPTNIKKIFLLVWTSENLSIWFCLTYFYIFTVLAMKTKVMYDVALKDGGSQLLWKVNVTTPWKTWTPISPSVCNKIKHLKLRDSEIKSDIHNQLTWKPQILYTSYCLWPMHTYALKHIYEYSLLIRCQYLKLISNNRETTVSVQNSFKSIMWYL